MGRSAKTHRGVHSEFTRLTRDGAPSDRDIWRALADGYRYKEMADYSTNPDADVSDEATAILIADAARFVDRVATLLSAPLPAAGGAAPREPPVHHPGPCSAQRHIPPALPGQGAGISPA